jgi:hypothetical protein
MILFIPPPDNHLITQIRIQTVAGGEKRHAGDEPQHAGFREACDAFAGMAGFRFVAARTDGLHRHPMAEPAGGGRTYALESDYCGGHSLKFKIQ